MALTGEAKKDYIWGWRQVEAIRIFFQCFFKGCWSCCWRELHIMTGFAKPYSITFAPSFWESCRDNLGWSEDEIAEFKRDAGERWP